MAKEGKSKGIVVNVDFSKAGGGGSIRVKPGDYKVKIKSVEQKESQSGNQMLVFEYQFLDGKAKGKAIKDRIVLQDNVLWKLRQLLEAVGKEVPSKMSKVNVTKLIGEELQVTVDDNEYNGRVSSQVQDYVQIMDDDDDEDTDDDEDDTDEDSDDEDLDEVDLDDEL